MYSVELKVSNQIFKGKGESIVDALNGIARPLIVKGKGILSVSDGEKQSKEVVLSPHESKRLLVNKTYRIILGKRLFNLLG